tara:strand:- start:42 stop:494 length:453 start_codon:yes stop_codon:yes gene_type:complete
MSTFPTRVMTSAGWVIVEGTPDPPDTRSAEEKLAEYLDRLPLKNHLACIKSDKAELRRIYKKLTWIKKGEQCRLPSYERKKSPDYWREKIKQASTHIHPKGIHAHIDYVNQKFNLNIPKDLLTDKEREKIQTTITPLITPLVLEEGSDAS